MSRKNHFKKPLPIAPYANGRRLPLFNDKAQYTLASFMTMQRDKRLYTVLCETEAAKKLRTKRPLIAVKLLEEEGVTLGLHPHRLAEELDISVEAARDAMNRAEFLIWEVFGVIVSFFGFGKPWRLLNHVEVALKYMEITKGNASKQKRAMLYRGAAQYHGQDKGKLEAPLFKFDFSSPDNYTPKHTHPQLTQGG